MICAKYGWTNVECDMLKCASCQAYLCASLQLTFDFDKCKNGGAIAGRNSVLL